MATAPTPRLNKAGKKLSTSGTVIQGGIISMEDYNARLTGPAGIRQWEIMRRSDPSIRQTLQAVKLPLMAATHTIKPSDDDPQGEERAEFVKQQLFNGAFDWYDRFRQMLTHFDFGFSVFEKLYYLTEYDGKPMIGLSDLSFIKQYSVRYWTADDQGTPGIRQQTYTAEAVSIPREKLLILTNDKEGDNDAGISLLRAAYKPFYLKDNLEGINAVALEKMAMGIPQILPVDGIDPGEDSKELEKLDDALRNMRVNEEAFLRPPRGYKVEFLNMQANSTKDVLPTIERYEQQIPQMVLAGFLNLGQGSHGGGAQALGKELTSFFNKSEYAAAQVIQSAIQNQVIKQLCDLNWNDMEKVGYPQYTIDNIADDDMSVTSQALQQLITAGAVTPDPDLEQYLRKTMNLPAMRPEDYEDWDEKHKPVDEPAEPGDPADKTIKPKDADPLTEDPKKETKASLIDAARSVRKILVKYED